MKWSEKLLHFIWRYKLINQSNLRTTQGEVLLVLDFGQYNTNAGADFEFAKIEINGRIWVGNVELHVCSLDWKFHQHHLDPRYNSTILHVVWENYEQSEAVRLDNTTIPTLVLKNYVDNALLEKYHQLMSNEQWMSCENQLHKVPELTISNWLDRLIIERLESKMEMVTSWAQLTGYDWEKVQLIAIPRAFGMKVNSDAFEKLMLQLNTNMLYKYANDPFKLEALLFGLSGFLSSKNLDDAYAKDLWQEFGYLKHMHGLGGQSLVEWKFLRMRPYNFPTYRMAQLCGLLIKRMQWFEFIKTSALQEVIEDLEAICTSGYWRDHFHFHKISKAHDTRLTSDFIQHIVLNAFIPILFTYGKYIVREDLQQKALEWLHNLKVEKNNIVAGFKERAIEAKTAGESQALLQLFRHYCAGKKCLDCAIGYCVLSR
ncbi:DUF2851 family protein [Sphingobacterium cavernae]|uniref:DUF2851 family protein n=1 Tax=Sphingobacterium cavernae TaxID=2592657 RepID=UPI00122FB4C7|nr:DUF2851 family protein [Sphingobacterium cavernae]